MSIPLIGRDELVGKLRDEFQKLLAASQVAAWLDEDDDSEIASDVDMKDPSSWDVEADTLALAAVRIIFDEVPGGPRS